MYTHESVTLSELPMSVAGLGTRMDVSSRGPMLMDRVQVAAATGGARVRKRKAEGQNHERLSKRLSLLNLERNGHKLYVPVEQPSKSSSSSSPAPPLEHISPNDSMQVDNTKHKVYIYDLDAEISDSDSDDGRLIFLPDIERHLRESRIPPSILANDDGELAGNTQLVLYNVPKSLTVPEERDSVRKAIIETRARARAKQSLGEVISLDDCPMSAGTDGGIDAQYRPNDHRVLMPITQEPWAMTRETEVDPDAMDLG